jgi:hypothetical protein
MTDNSNAPQSERILFLGLEGGSVTFYRRHTDTDGWEFWMEWDSMWDGEDETFHKSDPVLYHSWEELWEKFVQEQGPLWVKFVPELVHLDYCDLIWNEVKRSIALLDERERRPWIEYIWRRALGTNDREKL